MNSLLLAFLLFMQGAASGTGTVSGRLLTGSGNPAANVRIGLSPADDATELVGLTQTDNAGNYHIEKVPVGRYYLTAGLVNSPIYLPGVTSRADAIPILIKDGSTVVAPDFRLVSTPGLLTLKGRVILEGFPPNHTHPPLNIQLTEQQFRSRGGLGSAPRFTANIADDLSFWVPNLPAGNYSVSFFGAPTMEVIPRPQLLSVKLDRDIDNAQFTIPLYEWLTTIEGTVKIDGVAPLPSAGITLTNIDRTIANPDRKWGFDSGSFSMKTVPTGEYSVTLTGLPDGYSIKAMTSGAVNLLTQNLKVGPVDPPRIAITLSTASPIPGVRVVGQITNREQYRLPTAIQINSASHGMTLNATILTDGTFQFPTVPPGPYSVSFTSPIDSATRTIKVGEQDPARVEVPLAISNLRKIWVTVIGNTVALNPILRFTSPQGTTEIRATRGVDGANRNPSAKNLNEGPYEFLNVQPGSYQLILHQEGPPRGTRILPETAVPIVVADKDITMTLNAR